MREVKVRDYWYASSRKSRDESNGRISFRAVKDLARNKNYDFSDDGSFFRGYVYKGMLPVTVCSYEDMIYICIRSDYVVSYSVGKQYGMDNVREACFSRYNGIKKNTFNPVQFTEDLEKVLQKVLTIVSEDELKQQVDSTRRYYTRCRCYAKI